MSGSRKKAEKIKKKKKAPGKPAKVIPAKKRVPVKKAKAKPLITKKKEMKIKKKEVKPRITPIRKTDSRSSFLESLEVKRREIKETLDRLLSSRKEYSGQLTAGDFIDEIDDAQREISAYSQYSLIELKIKELQKVEQLINRIPKEEEFGLCEECGNPIPRERLLIVPEATLCVACQRELEKLHYKKSMAARGPSTFGSRKDMDWEVSGAPDEDDGMLIEYHIGSLPAVDIDEAETENPPEGKNEK